MTMLSKSRHTATRGVPGSVTVPSYHLADCGTAGLLRRGDQRFGASNRKNVPSLRPTPRLCAGLAPLAQSVERFHGKEKVNGSIPLGGSMDASYRRPPWRCSSVG